eukprot:COSAG05_NODE_888_length_6737_cov_9.635583_7_plen_76_part_00
MTMAAGSLSRLATAFALVTLAAADGGAMNCSVSPPFYSFLILDKIYYLWPQLVAGGPPKISKEAVLCVCCTRGRL